MFSVSTWNPTQGLGEVNKITKSQRSKAEFIKDINTDLTIISDYGKGHPIDLRFDCFEYLDRVIVGSRKGHLGKASFYFADKQPSYTVLTTYNSLEDGQICVLGIYAVTPLSNSRKLLVSALSLFGEWLAERKSLIVGDCNIWNGLSGQNGTSSKEVHNAISSLGFKSAFHVDKNICIGREEDHISKYSAIELFTYKDYQIESHIDYIFYSDSLKVVPGSSLIKPFLRNGNSWYGHSAVIANIKSKHT